jgi:hypothetical protein
MEKAWLVSSCSRLSRTCRCRNDGTSQSFLPTYGMYNFLPTPRCSILYQKRQTGDRSTAISDLLCLISEICSPSSATETPGAGFITCKDGKLFRRYSRASVKTDDIDYRISQSSFRIQENELTETLCNVRHSNFNITSTHACSSVYPFPCITFLNLSIPGELCPYFVIQYSKHTTFQRRDLFPSLGNEAGTDEFGASVKISRLY